MQKIFFIEDLIARSTCFGHHYAHHQELKSIIQWLLPVVFVAMVFKLLVWCGAEGNVSVLKHVVAPSLICGNKMPNRCNRGFFIADPIACPTCFGHHCAHHQELKCFIQWLLLVVFRALFFKLLLCCGAEGYVSGLQDAGASSLICGNKMPNRCTIGFLLQIFLLAQHVSGTNMPIIRSS